jgi:ABC-type transporter Mla MlaB component
MLKITRAVLSNQEITLRLDGRVAGQWVGLLRDSAESALVEGLNLTLDLKNISFIDCEGIALLKHLINRGVDPVNAPLFVIEQIKKCNDGQGETSNGDPNASLSSSF